MPIYEYRCHGCHEQFEVTQKITDPALTACPRCAGRVEKLISQSSFVLKGSGWYATDYAAKKKADGEKKAEGKEGTSCPATGSKSACSSCPSAAA